MPPVIIDVRKAHDARDVVHQAVQALVEGQLVVFPTETVYGVAASALNEQAVARLLEVKGRQVGHPLTLAVKSADEAWDFVPKATALGKRLARRCWPGPVTLVIEDNHPDSLLHQLPGSVQQAVSKDGRVGLRVPGHQLILDVLDLLTGPIALSSANRTGQPATTNAREVVDSLGDDVQLVLDDGQARFGQASSVVQIDASGMEMLREGVVTQSTLNRLASLLIVLVCTGNTCRSPMAEMILRKLMARRLGCKPDQLEDQGVVILSAGVAAMEGASASPEAVQVIGEMDMDLSQHVSQPINDRLIRDADCIWTMTHGHRTSLLARWPEAADRTSVLCPDGHDVSDPIGGPLHLYKQCAAQIEAALERRLDELDLEDLCP